MTVIFFIFLGERWPSCAAYTPSRARPGWGHFCFPDPDPAPLIELLVGGALCAATLVRFRHQTEPVAAHSAPPTVNQFPSIIISISFPNAHTVPPERLATVGTSVLLDAF